jgi:hypothetical protein
MMELAANKLFMRSKDKKSLLATFDLMIEVGLTKMFMRSEVYF